MTTEPDDPRRVLFICGKNQWRSPTAEHIFVDHPGLTCASAIKDRHPFMDPELVRLLLARVTPNLPG